MATSRETARDALVTLLAAALVPGTVNAVTGYQTPLGTNTPCVWVESKGSDRDPMTTEGNAMDVYLKVRVWVPLRVTAHEASMDLLDTIEKLIAGVLEDNIRTANWDSIEYAGRTEVEEMQDNLTHSIYYYRELISIRVLLMHN